MSWISLTKWNKIVPILYLLKIFFLSRIIKEDNWISHDNHMRHVLPVFIILIHYLPWDNKPLNYMDLTIKVQFYFICIKNKTCLHHLYCSKLNTYMSQIKHFTADRSNPFTHRYHIQKCSIYNWPISKNILGRLYWSVNVVIAG
jgi:hypothetical protein